MGEIKEIVRRDIREIEIKRADDTDGERMMIQTKNTKQHCNIGEKVCVV